MENNNQQNKLHSEEYFGEQRDYWWNRDFLDLMAKRWKLDQVESLLDIGCGLGHWGRLLAPYLTPAAKIIGVDREPEWVNKAREYKIARPANYEIADAMKLPFADESFDLVTCQTLLIHLKDPKAAILEFIRVLKPGGILAVAEPNNNAQQMVRSNLDNPSSIEKQLNDIRFQLICESGKINLGEGNNSVGDLIPGYLSECHLDDIQVYLSDKATPIFAPYNQQEQKVSIEQFKDYLDREVCVWDKEDTLRFFLAGGGTNEEFENHWKENLKEMKKVNQAIDAGNYHSAGGNMFYLISGRKI